MWATGLKIDSELPESEPRAVRRGVKVGGHTDGTNWTETSVDVPDLAFVHSLAYDQAHNLLYAGTDNNGVWKY
jgi:hypothetical protein